MAAYPKLIPVTTIGLTDPETSQVTLTTTDVTVGDPVSSLEDEDKRSDAVAQARRLERTGLPRDLHCCRPPWRPLSRNRDLRTS